MDGMGDAVLNNGSCDSLQQEAKNQIHDIEEAISENSKVKINNILKEVDTLLPLEKLLLYFKLPTDNSLVDPLKQPTNPLGSRSEIYLTIQWIKTHLEEDPGISLQKKNVYDEYTAFCSENKIKPLSTADFGKVMKQVYPKVRPRRLGTRGHSQYCYSGLRTRIKLQTPTLPDLSQKPQSSEFTIASDGDLSSAAWNIVKQWSEIKLGAKFTSFFELAQYLVKNLSIGIGTNAASVIVSVPTNEQNDFVSGDLANAVNSNRHKETIRKIQLKCEGKEQKRKLQVQQSKVEQRSRSKKTKIHQSAPCSTSTSRGPSPTLSPGVVIDNKQQSPIQGPIPVCDKALDFRSNGVTPQPEAGAAAGLGFATASQDGSTGPPLGKVPIPRLAPVPKTLQSPPPAKNLKYKHIQPKCDTVTYNPHRTVAELRSQETIVGKSRRLRKKEETVTPSLLDDDTNELLSRKRLISVANLDKDALDEYLGKNNSQENEEEITKIYESSIQKDDHQVKLSQLRSLLEQTTQNPIQDKNANIKGSATFLKAMDSQVVLPNFQHNLSARRRVSFDPPYSEEVPPSPTTAKYAFMPISPGSKSPTSRQSKCSSTTPSPFVSPRNTPLPRARGNSHPYLLTHSINKKPKKKEFELASVGNLPMSAPPSPKVTLSNAQMFHYNTEYKNSVQPDQLAAELNNLFANIPATNEQQQQHTLMRSQSVPVQNFISFQDNLNDFNNEFNDPGKIADFHLPMPETYITSISNYEPEANFTRRVRQPIMAETIEFSKLSNPSRSVPSTPVPNCEQKLIKQEVPTYSSRSYPSTPLTDDTFTYNAGLTQDYLLNGQPIKDKIDSEMQLNLIDIETKRELDLFGDAGSKDNFDFTVQYDSTFNVKQSENLPPDFEVIQNDYFKNS